ncbi:MAG: hypothetical protein DHS20C14_11110 [Phycisphaeraceae bacterium]|nr:MAG: hypothetical protein DHS20C14_11110 [Phycisphaeraceae bacterium]
MAAVGAPAWAAHAQLDGFTTEEAERAPVSARFVSERSALVAGRINILGVIFDMEPEWHIYWPGQNDTGMPTVISLGLPEGFEAKDTVFPAPHRYVSPGDLLDHVYEGPTLVIVPVFVPTSVTNGDVVTITADAEWLMCREACIPGFAEGLEITLPVVNSPGATSRTEEWDQFRETRKRTARPVGSALGTIETSVDRSGNGATVTISAERARKLAFYPDAGSVEVRELLAAGEAEGDRLSLALGTITEERGTLSGVLEVWGPGDEPPSRVYRIKLPLSEAAEKEGSGAVSPDSDS